MRGWAKWAKSIKEDTCWDEQWVFYIRDESLDCLFSLCKECWCHFDNISIFNFLKNLFLNVNLFLRERDRQSGSRGEAEREREGDTESEAGSML